MADFNLANIVNEGIKVGMNGGAIALLLSGKIMLRKKHTGIPKGACKPLKHCISKHACLKKGECPEEK